METFPDEAHRQKLEKIGISRAKHDLDSLRELLSSHFPVLGCKTFDRSVNELAEIIVYLAEKQLILTSQRISKND